MDKAAVQKEAAPARLVFRPDPKLLGSAEGSNREARRAQKRLRAELERKVSKSPQK